MAGKKLYKDYFNIDPKYYAAVTADLIVQHPQSVRISPFQSILYFL